MQLNNLKRNSPNKKKRTVGRGGKHAKTSGRGTKGQNARAGHKKRPEIRDFIKRIPKLRGRGVNVNTSIQSKTYPVTLSALNNAFKVGDTVTAAALLQMKLVQQSSGVTPRIKVLATGKIDKKLTLEGLLVSKGAKEAVEKAGGTVK